MAGFDNEVVARRGLVREAAQRDAAPLLPGAALPGAPALLDYDGQPLAPWKAAPTVLPPLEAAALTAFLDWSATAPGHDGQRAAELLRQRRIEVHPHASGWATVWEQRGFRALAMALADSGGWFGDDGRRALTTRVSRATEDRRRADEARRTRTGRREPDKVQSFREGGIDDEVQAWEVGQVIVLASETFGVQMTGPQMEPDDAERVAGALASAADSVRSRRRLRANLQAQAVRDAAAPAGTEGR